MIKKVGHIILSLLLVVAIPGLTINFHYCQEAVYDIAFFSEAESCCSPGQINRCDEITEHNHCKDQTEQQNHCEDETVIIEHIDDFIVTTFHFSHLSTVNMLFSVPLIAEHTNISKDIIQPVPDRDISPPNIQTVLSLLQTYLLWYAQRWYRSAISQWSFYFIFLFHITNMLDQWSFFIVKGDSGIAYNPIDMLWNMGSIYHLNMLVYQIRFEISHFTIL